MTMTAPKSDFVTASQHHFSESRLSQHSEIVIKVHGLYCAIDFFNKSLFLGPANQLYTQLLYFVIFIYSIGAKCPYTYFVSRKP